MPVDWSDKLKHMEMKDIMDIDFTKMSEELRASASKRNIEKTRNIEALELPDQEIEDESFTQYLNDLEVKIDNECSDNHLRGLVSYQSRYIGSSPAFLQDNYDFISHIDYLDEGVLITNEDTNN